MVPQDIFTGSMSRTKLLWREEGAQRVTEVMIESDGEKRPAGGITNVTTALLVLHQYVIVLLFPLYVPAVNYYTVLSHHLSMVTSSPSSFNPPILKKNNCFKTVMFKHS